MREVLLLLVVFHVRIETTSFVEAFATHGTRIGLPALQVGPPVLGQVPRKAEPASAVFALEAFLPCVDIHVVGEGTLDAECLLAYSAHERLLSRVPPLVGNH